MKRTKEEYDRIYQIALGRPQPLPKSTEQRREERFSASNQPTIAIVDAATTHNSALADRISSGERVQLSEWQQSVLSVERAVVARRRKEGKR